MSTLPVPVECKNVTTRDQLKLETIADNILKDRENYFGNFTRPYIHHTNNNNTVLPLNDSSSTLSKRRVSTSGLSIKKIIERAKERGKVKAVEELQAAGLEVIVDPHKLYLSRRRRGSLNNNYNNDYYQSESASGAERSMQSIDLMRRSIGKRPTNNPQRRAQSKEQGYDAPILTQFIDSRESLEVTQPGKVLFKEVVISSPENNTKTAIINKNLNMETNSDFSFNKKQKSLNKDFSGSYNGGDLETNSPGRMPGIMRSKQTVFDRVFDKNDLIREMQTLRNRL